MSETQMSTPAGVFELRRPSTSKASPLRAWSAADQLVLDELGTQDLRRLLIVNDEFGALSVALADSEPVVWTDSALSRSAIDANLTANGFDALASERSIAGDQLPEGIFDTVIMRVPKTAALLDLQLRAVAACVTEETRVIGTGMVRHIHTSTLTLFEEHIGATQTSLAKRKARLIHPEVRHERVPLVAVAPTEFITAQGVRVSERAGTFSAGHLDVGTALLLEVLQGVERPAPDAAVLDLGCGNGVIAATLALQWGDASFTLLDVSDLAVAAAQLTMQHNQCADRATIWATDGCQGVPTNSIDVVVTNPPFHQGHAIDRELTDRLLADTARVLTASGVAYVVVQRHLKLHATMARWFESVDVISKHPSHVVLEARNPKNA